MFMLLTRPQANAKLAKGMARDVLTYALHLAPADLSGYEVCPNRTAGCTAGCINTAVRSAPHVFTAAGIQRARIARTKWYFLDRAGFMAQLVAEIDHAVRHAIKKGYDVAIRLNATSDIPWHRIVAMHGKSIIDMFPTVQFYDYTKVAKRLLSESLPANYHLTFSMSETNGDAAAAVLNKGGNVAIVYRTKQMVRDLVGSTYIIGGVETCASATVVDGDENDLRYLDPRGVIVALSAKGAAKKDTSGFVRDI